MQWPIEIILSNSVVACLIALAAWLTARFGRRPALTHALCVIALLKLLTPPVFEIPLPLPSSAVNAGSIGRLPTLDAQRMANHSMLPAETSARTESNPGAVGNDTAADARKGGTVQRASNAPWRIGEPVAATDSHAESAKPIVANQRTTTPHGKETRSAEHVQVLSDLWSHVPQLAGGAWLLGTISWIVLQLTASIRLRRLLRCSTPPPRWLVAEAESIAHRVGLRRCPAMRVMPGKCSPMLCGVGRRACIILPANLLQSLCSDARATILAHELAHVARGDHWVRFVEALATAVYWWHPVVWWARKRIELAEEQCCDAIVLQHYPDKVRVYAEAILDIVDLVSQPRRAVRPAFCSGLRNHPLLQERLQTLFDGRCAATLTPRCRRTLLSVALVCLFCDPRFVASKPSASHAASQVIADFTPPTKEILDARHGVVASGTPAERTDRPVWAQVDSPDGRHRLSVRPGYDCELAELATGRIHPLMRHRVTCAAFSADDARLITGDLQGEVRIWETARGSELRRIAGGEGAIHSIDVSPDSRRVAAADEGGNAMVIDLVDPHASYELRFNGPIRCVRFSPSGERLAIAADTWLASTTGQVVIYDLVSQRTLQRWNCDAAIGAIQYMSEQSVLIADWRGRVERRRLRDGQVLGVDDIAKALVSAESFSVNSIAMDIAGKRMEAFKWLKLRAGEHFFAAVSTADE